MSAFGDKVQKVHEARVARVVRVPEWDLDLYVFPLTIGQLSAINTEADPFRRAARIVQVRGKRPDGAPLLDAGDVDALCSYGIAAYGPTVVVRVASEIMADDAEAPEPEIARKNS